MNKIKGLQEALSSLGGGFDKDLEEIARLQGEVKQLKESVKLLHLKIDLLTSVIGRISV